jgi:hypothetical protein
MRLTKTSKQQRYSGAIATLELWIAENSSHIEKVESGKKIIFHNQPEMTSAHVNSVRKKIEEWRELIEDYRTR